MGDTIHIKRNDKGALLEAIEVVESPDDGGWYLGRADFKNCKSYTSVRIYRGYREAVGAWIHKTVEWE